MRIITLPAFLVGIAFAILFFKLYGMVSRPDVPRPVAFVVSQFAPGVEIGSKVADAKHSVAAMTYVPHLGYVGLPKNKSPNLPDGNSVEFQQVRLLLDERTRTEQQPDPSKVRIDAVEVLSADTQAHGAINLAIYTLFRSQPIEGCLTSSEGSTFRDVHVWATPNQRGGVALITVHGSTERYRGLVVTSVVAFTGEFDGSRTLRGNYSDTKCDELTEGRS